MKNEEKRYLSAASGFFTAFVAFTVLVKNVDVKPIGALFSKVGFASLNKWFLKTAGRSDFWYDVSQLLGYLALAVCVCFVCIGFYQLISSKKGLKGVSRGIWATAFIYILVLVTYLFFEKVMVVNYRPIIGENSLLEPSYPSSHTMLALCVYLAAADQVGKLLDNRAASTILAWLCWLAAIATVVSRLLSGVHWLTDIIGAILVSASYICAYLAAAGGKR